MPKLMRVLSLAALGLLLPVTGRAQTPAAVQASVPTRGITSPAELEHFVDGLLGAWMVDKHIAGVTVSVVKDGALYFSKGYGYADVDAKAPVDPARTLFRIGSISKLFTWTAVMQLVEQGKLDLDTDINQYLDFVIPDTYPEPITLRHVMTHTPGLEEDGRDLFTTDSMQMKPMGEWLPSHMPARVRPPGVYASYSNWATAVAGYIVSRVSGMSFDDYIDEHIIKPLGMTYATTRQPLPAALAGDMSKGYQWKDGWYQEEKFEIITGAAPAGSISASADAMAKFMLAHLGGGALGDARILSQATADRMHSRIFGHDDRLPGFAHGFYEQSRNGLRIYGHGGDTGWFHSDLALIPSEGVGIFISTNTNTGGEISFAPFVTALINHYWPEERPVLHPAAGDRAGAARYAGEYLFNRMSYTTWQKALSLAGAITVRADTTGALIVATPFGGARLVSVDSMMFQDVATGDLYAFKADDSGKITHGFMGLVPMMVLEHRTGLSAPSLNRNLLILGLVLFVGILIAAVVRFFGRRSSGRPPADPAIRTGRRVMVLVALLQVGFVVLVLALASNPTTLMFGTPPLLTAALLFPVLGALLTLVALWVAIRQWRSGAGSLAHRIRHSGAVAIAIIFFVVLNAWNLLGWRY